MKNQSARAAIVLLLVAGAAGCADPATGQLASGARQAPQTVVEEKALAGVHERTASDDKKATIVAETDGKPVVQLAAFKSQGDPCLSLVKPAPGHSVCGPRDKQAGLFATGVSGPNEAGSGDSSVTFGWAPASAAYVEVSVEGSTVTAPTFVSETFSDRTFFIVRTRLVAPIKFRAYDQQEREVGTYRLG